MEGSSCKSADTAISALSDAKSVSIITKIASAEADSKTLLIETRLSKKALYIRLSRFMKIGILAKSNGKFSLTSFGKIVYHALELITAALDNYWRLSALDSLGSLRGLPIAEYDKICEKLLRDQQIKKAVSKSIRQLENTESPVCTTEILIHKSRSI